VGIQKMNFAKKQVAETPNASIAKGPRSGFDSILGRGTQAVFALLVGTGGVAHAEFIAERGDRGYRLPGLEYLGARGRSHRASTKTAAQNISRVREFFGVSITELAALFRVSRQAIYNWQAGQSISVENLTQLSELANAADFLSAEGLQDKQTLGRRKLPGGRTFFEAIYGGESAKSAASRLVSLVRHETAQRARISDRLANRAPKGDAYDDVGAPHLNERE
jgi:hypothetical protein